MTPKTYTDTSATVDKVISCATALFRKHGYRKTTVDDIASRVHISKKTLYSIFPAKDVILNEATWHDTMNVLRDFGKTFPDSARADMVLLSLFRYIFTDRIKQGGNGIFWGINSPDPDIHLSYLESLRRVVADIYREGREEGLFKPIDPIFGAAVTTGIMMAALDRFHTTENPVVLFNEALYVIADAVAFRDRIVFDRMG